MEKDSYITIKGPSEGIFKDKGSKFLAYAYPVSDIEQVKPILKKLKKEFYDARHHCYAFKIGLGDENYRYSDDGEPSGTAGKPIYGQILSNSISDVLIVVVRYFGGTLLGTSGLINAYKNAAADCIQKAELVGKIIKQKIQLAFSYELLSLVMRVIKEGNYEILKQDFTTYCELTINVRLNEYDYVLKRFTGIYGVEIQ